MGHATQDHIESIWARTFDQVRAASNDVAKATEAADAAVAAFKRATQPESAAPASAEVAPTSKAKKQ
jgi:hypothetical protein